MNATVKQQPALTEAEWTLIVELLERERLDLPAEIHHTDTTAVRDQLRERLKEVDHLLHRIRGE